MSAKILPFRPPRRPAHGETSKFSFCPFCSFFTTRTWEMDRHLNADHMRAMKLYGYKKESEVQTS